MVNFISKRNSHIKSDVSEVKKVFVSGVGVYAFQLKASKRKMQLSERCLWAQAIMQVAMVERTVNFLKVNTMQSLPFWSHCGMQFELDTPCADLTHVV